MAAERLLDRLLEKPTVSWPAFDPDNLPPETRFAATGGNIISSNELREFRGGLQALASIYGFGRDSGRTELARFDAAASEFLATQPFLTSGEALRDDVWTFFAVVLAPDIVHWRFGSARERYLGGVRNAFQRLWIRARALDRGADASERWMLLELLTEDALVQITERPSIGADPLLSRQLGEAWVRAAERYGRGAMEPIMRLAVLRLRISNEIRSLSGLPSLDLKRTMDEFFRAAALSLHIDERADLLGHTAASSASEGADPVEPRPEERTSKSSWAIWRRR